DTAARRTDAALRGPDAEQPGGAGGVAHRLPAARGAGPCRAAGGPVPRLRSRDRSARGTDPARPRRTLHPPSPRPPPRTHPPAAGGGQYRAGGAGGAGAGDEPDRGATGEPLGGLRGARVTTELLAPAGRPTL